MKKTHPHPHPLCHNTEFIFTIMLECIITCLSFDYLRLFVVDYKADKVSVVWWLIALPCQPDRVACCDVRLECQDMAFTCCWQSRTLNETYSIYTIKMAFHGSFNVSENRMAKRMRKNLDKSVKGHMNVLTACSFTIVTEITLHWLHSYARLFPHHVDLRHAEFWVQAEE